MKGVFGVYFVLLDDAKDFIQQRAVFQNEQVGVKNANSLCAHAFTDLPLRLQNLLACLNEGFLEPIDLFRDSGLGYRTPDDVWPNSIQNKNLASAYT